MPSCHVRCTAWALPRLLFCSAFGSNPSFWFPVPLISEVANSRPFEPSGHPGWRDVTQSRRVVGFRGGGSGFSLACLPSGCTWSYAAMARGAGHRKESLGGFPACVPWFSWFSWGVPLFGLPPSSRTWLLAALARGVGHRKESLRVAGLLCFLSLVFLGFSFVFAWPASLQPHVVVRRNGLGGRAQEGIPGCGWVPLGLLGFLGAWSGLGRRNGQGTR